jgi:hypothetical protein
MTSITRRPAAGGTLLEVLVATSITAGVCAAAFQVFHHHEAVFRDQNLVLEMQQAARAVMAQIGDDVRTAGQGVPVTVSSRYGDPGEATAAVMAGSDSSRLRVRAALSNAATRVVGPIPLSLTEGSPVNLAVEDAGVVSAVTGAKPLGRYVYLWGRTDHGEGWARARVVAIATASNSMQLVPEQTMAQPMRLTSPATLSLEEAVAIHFDASTRSVRRTTATDFSDPQQPSWAPANEVAANVSALSFSYYDAAGAPLAPATLDERRRIARIDARVVVLAPAALRNGSRPSVTLSLRIAPRNLELR